MKKNVKYIGSAIAVALLAAGAPVVIPEIIPSNVVAAATYNPNTLYGDIQGDSIVNSDDDFTKSYFAAFKNQFEDQYVSDYSGLVSVLKGKKDYVPGGSEAESGHMFSYLDPENPAEFKDFQDDKNIELLNSRSGRTAFDSEFSTEYDSKYYFRDILVSMEVVDGNGKTVKLQNSDDYQTAIDNFEAGSIPFPLTFHVRLTTDKSETRYTPNTLDRLNQMDSSLTNFEFKLYQSQFNINKKDVSTRVGTSISDFDGTGNDLSIIDKSTEGSSDSKERTPIFGKSLFKNSSDAISYAKSSDFNPDATDQGETGLISSDGTVSEPGEYYQTISYKLENGTNDDAAISAMLSGENDPNTNQPVPVYKTSINGVESTENTDFVINKSKGLLTLTRLVSVSEDNRADVTKNISTANADFNSSAKSEEDSERENNTNTLNDKNGNSLINDSDANKGITFGDNYYSEDTDPSKVLNNDKDSSVNVTDSSGNFIQSGNYLRTITFHLIAGSVDTNKFGTEENKDYVLNTDNNTVTYIQKVHIGDPIQKIDVTVDIPDVNVYCMDPVNTNTDELKISTKSGDIISSNVEIGTSYYGSAEDALKKTNPKTIVKNGVYNSIGNTYRTVTYTLPKNVSYYILPEKENKVGYTTDGNTVTYVQKVKINRMVATVTVDPLKIPLGTSINDSSVSNENIGFSIKANNKELNHNDPVITFIRDNTGYNVNNYFANKEDALDGSPISTSIIENGKFVHSGTYYRIIKITNNIKQDSAYYQLISDSGNMKVIPGGTRYYYYAQPVIVSEPKETSENVNNLTVIAGTPSDGVSIDGTKLSDPTVYDIKDVSDSDNPNSIVSNVTIGDYYESEKDVLEGDKSKTADTTKGLTKSAYYRTITFKLNEGDGYKYSFPNAKKVDAENDEVTYIQEITATTLTPSVNIKDASTTTGTSSTAKSVENPTDITLTGKDNKSLIKSDPTFDGFYDKDGNKLSDVVDKNGNFAKAGTYYQKVTIPLTDNADYAYDFNSLNGTVNHEAETPTVTFMRAITVNQHHSSGGSSTNTGNEDNPGTEDEWTYHQDAGVVTTKTTEPTYSLNNHANETIQNRALSEDSSWVTDQYRVNNRTGVKQYRVATGEWIDANDVYFRDNGNGTGTEDEWTYYKDPGVVLTKETQEYYSLNNRANETIQNRALSEDSGWITDQYRVNNRTGVKQYRVATGEWIDSHDVIFVKDVQMIVNVDETKDYYNLYDIQKNTNSNRALEKKTSWLTDKVAIDYDGSTYYRVATNEWVKQENGVHLDTSVWYKN